MRYVFFRNDDLRQTLDNSLIKLTEIFTSSEIPISHAVEPANLTAAVAEWLISEKERNPGLIEIIQHGYDHKLKFTKTVGGKIKKGEFGGTRTYEEQFEDIRRGRQIMDSAFGSRWFQAFTFPFGGRNEAALKAVADNGFLVINGSMGNSVIERIFYLAGRLLKRELLFDRKVSWNLRLRKDIGLFQIDTAVSIISSFFDEQTGCSFHSFPEIKAKIQRSIAVNKNTGIVLHHRYHTKAEHFQLVSDIISYLKQLQDVQFVTQEFLYNTFRP